METIKVRHGVMCVGFTGTGYYIYFDFKKTIFQYFLKKLNF